MDKQDKIWDDVLGFLAWKFKETESGDMHIESDMVIPELKGKYSIKTYESFVSENMGAISMRTETSREINRQIPPDVNTPMNIPMNFGGSRLPSHWTNAPYMSGQYGPGGGASLSGFGANPTSPGDAQKVKYEDIKAYRKKQYTSLDELKTDYDKLAKISAEYEQLWKKILREREENMIGLMSEYDYKLKIINAANDILGIDVVDTMYDDFNLDIDYEVEEEPTPGDPGDYYTPPDGGDPGSYTFPISHSEGNREALTSAGFNSNEVNAILDHDMESLAWLNLSKYNLIIKRVSSLISTPINNLHDEFDDPDSRRELELFDFGIEDPIDIFAFMYMLKGSTYKYEELRDLHGIWSTSVTTLAYLRRKESTLRHKLKNK